MHKIISWLNSHPEIKSVITTFVATFIVTVATLLQASDEEWITLVENGMIWGMLIAAARSAVKLAIGKALLLLSAKAE